MKLSYRGLTYQSTTEVMETIETGHVGRFLGLPYSVRQPVATPVARSTRTLRYRGLPYSTIE